MWINATSSGNWIGWHRVAMIDYLCNPNLLDNWYFGNPVNQRGYKLYKDIGYTIDRWKLDINPGEGISVNDGYITLNTSGIYFGQYFDNLQNFKGKTFTGTILCADGNLYSGTFIYNAIINQGQMFFPSVNGSPGMYIQQLSDTLAQVEINTLTDNVSIIAVKLEFGNTQTLAHKEGDTWVLNEISDYGEQLRRCQRYFVRFPACHGLGGHQTGTSACFRYSLDVPMRTVPSLVLENQTDLTNALDDGASAATPLAFHVWGTNQADCIAFWFEGAPTPNTCWTCQRYIDASADL